jgi:predicted TIM-barrel fold metal-dependent hydrolase
MPDAFPPAGACDCHVHVIGPKTRYPLARERAYTPPDAPLDQLRTMLARLKLDRVVLVQPSIYGEDNSCMMDAIDALGESARGVAVLPGDASGSEVDDLDERGVRGLRVNVVSTLMSSLDQVRERFAAAAELCARNGWHVQVFLPVAAVEPLEKMLLGCPVPVVIDHFALVSPGPDAAAHTRRLGRLIESGHVWLKLSAPYRLADDPADPRIRPLARQLAAANPERVVWGSDWPHTAPHGAHHVGENDAEVPYLDLDTGALLNLLRTWFDDPRMQQRVLVENPARLYGFGPQ